MSAEVKQQGKGNQKRSEGPGRGRHNRKFRAGSQKERSRCGTNPQIRTKQQLYEVQRGTINESVRGIWGNLQTNTQGTDRGAKRTRQDTVRPER